MSKERLILVERFEELRAGMIVVVKGCVRCSHAHRGILTSCDHEPASWPDGRVETDLTWNYYPTPACSRGKIACFGINAVRTKKLYRVQDELGRLDKLEKSRSTPKRQPARAR